MVPPIPTPQPVRPSSANVTDSSQPVVPLVQVSPPLLDLRIEPPAPTAQTSCPSAEAVIDVRSAAMKGSRR